MPKVLTYLGMFVAGLMVLLFGLDLAAGVPFGREPSMWMDLCALLAGAILGYLSWSVRRELV